LEIGSQFYQGVVDGSPGTNDWQYGLKGDYFLTVIGEKAGLWKGIIFNVHAETRAGDDVNALTGLSPANVNMLMPNSDNTTAITQAMAIQMVGEQTGLLAGKINALDFLPRFLSLAARRAGYPVAASRRLARLDPSPVAPLYGG